MLPFTSRYSGLSNKKKIIQLATVRPDVLVGLDAFEPRTAASKLQKKLEQIYIPNEFSVDFIAEMVESSLDYNSSKFCNDVAYLRSIFHHSLQEVSPICLTGLAGVGKSALISALTRVLPNPVSYSIPRSNRCVDLLAYWLISARDKPTIKQVLLDIIKNGQNSSEALRRNTPDLLRDAQKYVGKVGLSLLVVEELQHMSISATATAAVVSLLLTLSKLGVPMVYVCNYSLGHKLFKRNAEEKQRLLSNSRIMLPDEPDSDDWNRYVDECIRVLDCYISVSRDFLSGFLYVNTYGLKRLVVNLMRIAYYESRARKRPQIEVDDFFSALISPEYTGLRKDVLVLCNQEINFKNNRDDLRCPFELPKTTPSILAEHYEDLRQREVSNMLLESSLSAKEIKNWELLEAKKLPETDPKSSRRNAKVSLEDLIVGQQKLTDLRRS